MLIQEEQQEVKKNGGRQHPPRRRYYRHENQAFMHIGIWVETGAKLEKIANLGESRASTIDRCADVMLQKMEMEAENKAK